MHFEQIKMTLPLWGLAIFIVWTIAGVALLLIVRIRHLSAGGSVKDFGIPNDESLLWRLFRVQANLALEPTFVSRSCVPSYCSGCFRNRDQCANHCIHRVSACTFSDSHCWSESKVSALKLRDSVRLPGCLNCPGLVNVNQS